MTVFLYRRWSFGYLRCFATALQKCYALNLKFVHPGRGLVHEVETSRTAIAKAVTETERQNGSVRIAKKLSNNTLNDLISLRGWVSVAGTRNAEIRSSATAA